ncbi:MAG: septum formation initiator family protein [Bacilli bacterium]|nr:septum formation initiator family protein [Bacilli bacterium]
MARRRKYSKKAKGRMVIFFLFFISVIVTLSFTLFSNLRQISDIRKEKKVLVAEKQHLLEKQAALEADIGKLSDDDYIARYAREKYFYSRPGEIILKIDGE